mmetsp:Transcript_24785/g.76553  ORF Transcript_24785/g.76553 Transcript_24785/m.76553 type:complete len:146 (+) Transcript_24785:69-506(+)
MKPSFDTRPSSRQEYNALRDPNMRHYFQNRSVQAHLYHTGQIDRAGRVIELEKNKSKLHVIEQEFKAAERNEFWRKKEEDDMRHRVQQKRHDALARARRQEKLMKMKEDRRIRREIVRAARGLTALAPHTNNAEREASLTLSDRQ